MQDKENSGIRIELGKFPKSEDNYLSIFDRKIINFLDELSVEIINNFESRKFPDLIDFGFWCRKKNIIKISEKIYNKYRIPKGIALHIAPSNVAMNCAFSMGIGLLSGCKNIIRLPSKKFKQIDLLIKIIKKILKKKFFFILNNYICFVRYEKSDCISRNLSLISDVRLIWGGDKTAKLFKSFPTKLKCNDLIFPNKYSGSILNFKEISNLSKVNLENLAKKFYSDTYTMDQLGCSSPKIIFLINYKKKDEYFWKLLEKCVKKNYENDFSVTNKKIYNLNLLSIKNKINKSEFYNFKVNLIKLKKNENLNLQDIDKISYGTFIVINIKNLNEIKKYLKYNFQTLTYFGFEKSKLEKEFLIKNFKNIDRIVKVGQAFNMSIVWDGYNIIEGMTKVVEIS